MSKTYQTIYATPSVSNQGFTLKVQPLQDGVIFEKDKPMIINFFADWCGPCQMFTPTLSEINDEYAGKITIYKINIDQSPEIAALFGIKSVPTTLFLKKNEEPIMTSGVMAKESLLRAITEVFRI